MRFVMEVADVLGLRSLLLPHGVDWCIVGGWGVDALLGEQTRAHKDLDVLVSLDQLRPSLDVLKTTGFGHAYAWEENLPLDGPRDLTGRDSAFVMRDDADREVDIHVYDMAGSKVRPLWVTDRALLPRELSARGLIGDEPVSCLAAEAQLRFHRGYTLPETHRHDVERLGLLAARHAR
jgi:lincosamide nucleotidyltransferase A/C/D/E